jgi:phosphoserine phosphatase
MSFSGGPLVLDHRRLVAFDVDGTLIASRDGRVVWQLLNERFGGHPEENRRRYAAYLDGEITYPQWVDLDVGAWVAVDARRDQMVQAIEQQLYLVPGARRTLAALKAAGHRLAVISGTLDLTLEVLFPEHPFDEVFTNRIWFSDDGRIAGWEATPYDMEGKAEGLADLARRQGIPLERTVYVGDHINDIQAMELAGLAVAFEPKHPSVRQAADAVVEHDLRGVLELLR